jgi:hypothetical protein
VIDKECCHTGVRLWPIATDPSFGPVVSFWAEAEVSGRQSSPPRSKLTHHGSESVLPL